MKNKFYCDICNAPMHVTERIQSKKKYRIRRFMCDICGYETTIFGNGWKDVSMQDTYSEYEVNKMFKQEEDARK
jgi:hypothetical protein